MSEPILCRMGFHRYGPNTRWPKSTPGFVRWERHCRRCGSLLVFSLEPFVFGPIDRLRERKRKAREAAEMGA